MPCIDINTDVRGYLECESQGRASVLHYPLTESKSCLEQNLVKLVPSSSRALKDSGAK